MLFVMKSKRGIARGVRLVRASMTIYFIFTRMRFLRVGRNDIACVILTIVEDMKL